MFPPAHPQRYTPEPGGRVREHGNDFSDLSTPRAGIQTWFVPWYVGRAPDPPPDRAGAVERAGATFDRVGFEAGPDAPDRASGRAVGRSAGTVRCRSSAAARGSRPPATADAGTRFGVRRAVDPAGTDAAGAAFSAVDPIAPAGSGAAKAWARAIPVTSPARTAPRTRETRNRRGRGREDRMFRGLASARCEFVARWSRAAPDDGVARRGRQERSGGGRWGSGQSPVPAASVIAARNASLNVAPHGPCPASTYGEVSTLSNVSGSVTNDLAQVSTVARSRS